MLRMEEWEVKNAKAITDELLLTVTETERLEDIKVIAIRDKQY